MNNDEIAYTEHRAEWLSKLSEKYHQRGEHVNAEHARSASLALRRKLVELLKNDNAQYLSQ